MLSLFSKRSEPDDSQRRRYASLGDEDLLRLNEQDLTDEAQAAYRSELSHRNLAAKESESTKAREPEEFVTQSIRLYSTVTAMEYATMEDAELARYALIEAGIDSMTFAGTEKFDRRPPQLRVMPDDLDRAKAILALPPKAEHHALYEEDRRIGDFVPPRCPVCSSADVLLEVTDEVDEWRCDECGHLWRENVRAV